MQNFNAEIMNIYFMF